MFEQLPASLSSFAAESSTDAAGSQAAPGYMFHTPSNQPAAETDAFFTPMGQPGLQQAYVNLAVSHLGESQEARPAYVNLAGAHTEESGDHPANYQNLPADSSNAAQPPSYQNLAAAAQPGYVNHAEDDQRPSYVNVPSIATAPMAPRTIGPPPLRPGTSADGVTMDKATAAAFADLASLMATAGPGFDSPSGPSSPGSEAIDLDARVEEAEQQAIQPMDMYISVTEDHRRASDDYIDPNTLREDSEVDLYGTVPSQALASAPTRPSGRKPPLNTGTAAGSTSYVRDGEASSHGGYLAVNGTVPGTVDPGSPRQIRTSQGPRAARLDSHAQLLGRAKAQTLAEAGGELDEVPP